MLKQCREIYVIIPIRDGDGFENLFPLFMLLIIKRQKNLTAAMLIVL